MNGTWHYSRHLSSKRQLVDGRHMDFDSVSWNTESAHIINSEDSQMLSIDSIELPVGWRAVSPAGREYDGDVTS